jgi:hypothetical protein
MQIHELVGNRAGDLVPVVSRAGIPQPDSAKLVVGIYTYCGIRIGSCSESFVTSSGSHAPGGMENADYRDAYVYSESTDYLTPK